MAKPASATGICSTSMKPREPVDAPDAVAEPISDHPVEAVPPATQRVNAAASANAPVATHSKEEQWKQHFNTKCGWIR